MLSMEKWISVGISLIILAIIISSCMQCCKNYAQRSETTYDLYGSPVVVTSATHTAPGGYPVSQMPPSGGIPANVYAAPYPTGQHNMNITNMPMHMPPQPPPAAYQQHVTPYPPYPPMGVQPAATMNPPSYEAAVRGVGTGADNTIPYEKQAPYNPNFSGQ